MAILLFETNSEIFVWEVFGSVLRVSEGVCLFVEKTNWEMFVFCVFGRIWEGFHGCVRLWARMWGANLISPEFLFVSNDYKHFRLQNLL